MGLNWSDFSTPESDAMEKKYLPDNGEGDNKATQAVTACVKLIYKWFNDGDVFDNTYTLKGWANDLSTYANWLYKFVPGTQDILRRIERINDEEEYTQLLYDLMNTVMTEKLLGKLESQSAEDSVYECIGPFEFDDSYDDDDDEYDDDDDDWA